MDPHLLYDSNRKIRYTKPLLRGWMHLLFFEASLILGTLLLVSVHGAEPKTAVAVYVGSVSGLFGVSAAYHRGNWGATASRILQRLDHAMIFALIAGTATPAFLLAVPGVLGIVGIAALWTLALVAMAVHLVWMNAPEKLVGTTYIALGCLAGSAIPAVWVTAGVAAGLLMIVGGALYIVGAVSYHRRRPDPRPLIFGYHEVFHTYVSVAAACQFVAVALLSWSAA